MVHLCSVNFLPPPPPKDTGFFSPNPLLQQRLGLAAASSLSRPSPDSTVPHSFVESRVCVPSPVVEPVEDSDCSESASDGTSESEDESLLAPLPPTRTGRVRSRPTRFADFTCH